MRAPGAPAPGSLARILPPPPRPHHNTFITPDELFTLAVSHHQANRLADALPLYQQLLPQNLNHPDLLHNLATLYLQTSRPSDALPLLRHLTTLQPSAPAPWLNLALTHIALDDLPSALTAFQTLTRLDPQSPSHWSNLGTTHERLGHLADAEQAHRHAISLNPNYAPAHNNLGAVLAAQNRLPEALAAHHASIAAGPTYQRAYVNLSHTALLAGQPDTALAAATKAVELSPNDLDAHRNLAPALQELGQTAAASQAYTRALSLLDPESSPASRQLHTRLRLARATLLPQIYESKEDLLTWRARLTENLQDLTRDHVKADLTNDPAPTLFPLAYQGFNDRALMEQYASLLSPPQLGTRNSELGTKPTGPRIRVAFISRFFHNHTIGRLNLGLVRHLNRDQFEVTVFSLGNPNDETSQAFQQSADHYVVLPPHLPTARTLILQSQPHILVYPDLGMDPFTWSLAFSRLAPTQLTTWGHPVTTGIPTLDHFLSTDSLDPPGNESHYSENLIRLKHLPVYYYRPTPLASSRNKSSFGLDEDWHLYGCLQMPWKLHPDFDPLLAKILRRDPAGRLLLIQGVTQHWDHQLLSRWQRTMPDVTNRILFLPMS